MFQEHLKHRLGDEKVKAAREAEDAAHDSVEGEEGQVEAGLAAADKDEGLGSEEGGDESDGGAEEPAEAGVGAPGEDEEREGGGVEGAGDPEGAGGTEG